MSLRAIEMQVSIPRTQNVGKIVDQLQQRGQVSQDVIAAEQNKEDEKKRKQVLEAEETEKKRLNNDDESQNGAPFLKNKNEKNASQVISDQQLKYAKHPYKGNNIDVTR